jgi:hypothetical protein
MGGLAAVATGHSSLCADVRRLVAGDDAQLEQFPFVVVEAALAVRLDLDRVKAHGHGAKDAGFGKRAILIGDRSRPPGRS